MPDEPKPPSEWARKRAAGKARRQARVKRREAYFDLLVSGYSVEQIANATKTSRSTVRRAIGKALADRKPDSAEDFFRLQITRLHKALRCVDVSLEDGDLEAVAPYLRVLVELTRFQGFAVHEQGLAPLPVRPRLSRAPQSPPALTHESAPLALASAESFTKEVVNLSND